MSFIKKDLLLAMYYPVILAGAFALVFGFSDNFGVEQVDFLMSLGMDESFSKWTLALTTSMLLALLPDCIIAVVKKFS